MAIAGSPKVAAHARAGPRDGFLAARATRTTTASVPDAGRGRLRLRRSDAHLLVGIWVVAFTVRVVPVLLGGGLWGVLGYDDGVYFGGSIALLEGALPYRDYLLLHPPGIVVALAPLAALGGVTSDPDAFAAARAVSMGVGATSAVLVALVAGRYDRTAGLVAGSIYALWSSASHGERTTDLHAVENALALLGLLVLSEPGRV